MEGNENLPVSMMMPSFLFCDGSCTQRQFIQIANSSVRFRISSLLKGKNKSKETKFTYNRVYWNENLPDLDYDVQAFSSPIAPLLLSKNASQRVFRQRHDRRKGDRRASC